MLRVITRNVACNWIGFAVQAVTTLLLTPIVIENLGESVFGLWALVTGLTGYYGLVDLGLRSGTTQYLTRYLAQKDFQRLNQSFNSALAALSSIAGLVLLFSIVVSWVGPRVVTMPIGVTTHEAGLSILLVGMGIATQFVLFPFSSLFAATQRYDLTNAIGIFNRVVTASAMYVVVTHGGGIVQLSIVNAVSNGMEYIARAIIGRRLVPEIQLRLADINWDRMKEFATYGVWTSLASLSAAIRNGTDLLIVGILLGTPAVARFTLASRIVKYLREVIGSMIMVFFPTATALHAKGDRAGLIELWFHGSRAVFLALGGFSVIAWQWSDEFYRLWVGAGLTERNLPAVSPLFRLLLIVCIASFAGGVGHQILLGCKLVRVPALLSSVETTVNLVLSCVLGYFYGVWGVAFGALISVVLIRLFTEPVYIARQMECSVLQYWRHAAARPLLVSTLLYVATAAFRSQCPPITERWQLLAHGVVAVLMAMALIGLFGIDRIQRQVIVSHLSRRFFRSTVPSR